MRRLTKALSDGSRLRLLRMLSDGPANFTDVVALMKRSKSTVNHHLIVLRAAGLVRVHDPGDRSTTYTLRPLLLIGAASYIVAAITLAAIRTSFNRAPREPREQSTMRADVVEGLRYVLGNPILRNISIMIALVNFVGTTSGAQLVLFAKDRVHVGNTEVGFLFSAGGAEVVLCSCLARRLRKRWSFNYVALGALTFLIPLDFSFTSLGPADRYLPKTEAGEESRPLDALG